MKLMMKFVSGCWARQGNLTIRSSQAMFTVTGDVIEDGKCENRQLFEQQLTLRDLNIALQIVCKLLGGYKLLSVCPDSTNSQQFINKRAHRAIAGSFAP